MPASLGTRATGPKNPGAKHIGNLEGRPSYSLCQFGFRIRVNPRPSVASSMVAGMHTDDDVQLRRRDHAIMTRIASRPNYLFRTLAVTVHMY